MDVVLYTSDFCGYCVRAKALLDRAGVPYSEVALDAGDPELRTKLEEATGGMTLPQIVIDGRPVGGYAELVAFERSGGLGRAA